ncbi:MAG TPA: LPS assembly lipoprotein LptE [Rudaea sp.]|jgi:LPS-assembly lipoprotein|nr:LPS assembly lipoprotein LptE [Rudaea sp.]
MKSIRSILLIAALLALTACGFHMRGEVVLPSGLQRVHVQIADPFSPLKRDLEAALRRGGAKVEENAGEGIADVVISAVSLGPVARSVGANAYVNEFSMVYHVEVQITDAANKVVIQKQVIEHSREFTFDQTQAIGTTAEQDEIKKEMERDMVQAILRKVDAAAKAETAK